MVAFNRRVAEELTKRLPAYASATTLNALGYKAWRGYCEKNVEVDANKIATLVRTMSDDDDREFKAGVKKLVDMAKLAGIVPLASERLGAKGLVPDDDEEWEELIARYNIVCGDEKEQRAISLARRVLTENIRLAVEKIDFNDQLYLPIIFGATFIQYDWIFADECQDLSALNIMMLRRAMGRNSRFVGVGDSAQSLYAFRGAGDNAIPDLIEAFNAKVFPLSISYRCPRAVVEHARQYSSKIELWDQAEEGRVEELKQWSPAMFEATDVILCRNNAPLVSLAFKIIRSGKPCKVLGRDIGTGLVALVRKMKVISTSDLKSRLDEYVVKQQTRLVDDPAALLSLLDSVDTIHIFLTDIGYGATIDSLCDKITRLFDDDAQRGCVLLSTVHKAKGLEWPRVYILDRHLIGMRQEEPNVAYVAVTRSQRELFFINS